MEPVAPVLPVFPRIGWRRSLERVGADHATVVDIVSLKNGVHHDAGPTAPNTRFDIVADHVFANRSLHEIPHITQPSRSGPAPAMPGQNGASNTDVAGDYASAQAPSQARTRRELHSL